MVDCEYPTIKKLLIFYLKTITHNALVSLIDLDETLYKEDNYIFIEDSLTTSPIFLYVFYGGKTYQAFRFQPENLLKNSRAENRDLFLPGNQSNMRNYPENEVQLMIYPDYSKYPHIANTTMNVKVVATNHGLKIESRKEENKIWYTQLDSDILSLSLLDYFDGFNVFYNLDYFDQFKTDDPPFNYTWTNERKIDHIIDAVNSNTQVEYAFMLSNETMVVFYDTIDLVQVS